MKFMVDANVDDEVGDVLLGRGYVVDFANKSFLPGTPDNLIDSVARAEGWIIVSHDQRFLNKIQQPRYQFASPVSSGYGRIMLMTRESLQVSRTRESFDLVETLFTAAVESGRRFLICIGPSFIRYDDIPLAGTRKGTHKGTDHHSPGRSEAS